MNDLGKEDLEENLISCADDAVVIEEVGETWAEAKQNAKEDLRKIINWLNGHKLILNLGKTNFVQFGLKNEKKKNEEDTNLLIHHKQSY